MSNRYRTIEQLRTKRGVRYLPNVIYPDVPYSEEDIYIITTGADRYDTLANQFYNDSSLWWVIAIANNSKKDGLIVQPGVQLRIPADGLEVKAQYELLNKNR